MRARTPFKKNWY